MFQVLIPAYNTAEYLEDCIKSIEGQTSNTEYEILLGIDGCEKTLKKAKNLLKTHNNLKVYYCQENKGRYIMSNTLIELSTADDLIFFDSDDLMMTNLFQTIEENQCDILGWSYRVLKDNKIYPPPKNDWAKGCFYCTREVINELGGFEPWCCSADSEFHERAKALKLKHYLFVISQQPLQIYRRHSNSLTDTIPMSKRIEQRKKIKFNGYKLDEIYVERVINNGRYI